VKPQTELSPDELQEFFGRDFGAEKVKLLDPTG